MDAMATHRAEPPFFDTMIVRYVVQPKFPRAPEMAEQTGAYVSFQAEGKLLTKITGQGKVAPLITKGGLKSNGHNLFIGLKSGPVGSAIQIAK